MIELQFHDFDFDFLQLEQARKLLPAKVAWATQDEIEYAFLKWVDKFHWNATRSYAGLIQYYYQTTRRRFSTKHNLDFYFDDYQLDREQEQEWESLVAQVRPHADFCTAQIERIDEYKRSYLPHVYNSDGREYSPLRSMREIIEEMELDQTRIHASVFNEVWFDMVINTPADQQKALRKIPYTDYLKTEHWRRVRLAALLVHRSRCRAGECLITNEMYFGEDLRYLHIHHLNYKHRGNERFVDIVPLCKEHHESAHRGYLSESDIAKVVYTPIGLDEWDIVNMIEESEE